MIVFNLSGLVIAVAALLAGAGLSQLASSLSPQREVAEWAAGLAGFAAVAASMDLYRRRSNAFGGKIPLFDPGSGGHVMILPLWLYGVAASAGAAYLLVTCPESNQQVLDRYKPAAVAEVARLSAALALLPTAAEAGTASIANLDPKPFVDRPTRRSNTAFYYAGLADEAVNGRHSEPLFYLQSWYGLDRPDGKTSLWNPRGCAQNLHQQIEEALAIRYLVARQTGQPDQFFLIDLNSPRILGSFNSAADETSMRDTLARLTGGTFVFR